MNHTIQEANLRLSINFVISLMAYLLSLNSAYYSESLNDSLNKKIKKSKFPNI